MTDINSVIVTGRIVRDLGERDFTYLSSGTAKLRFSVAVNKSVKNADGSWGEKAAFFDVIVWGKYAESLKPRLAKGAKVTVCGRLERDVWEDKQTKASREKIYITAETVILSQSQSQSLQSGQSAVPVGNIGSEKAELEDDGFVDDIPF